MPVPLEFLRGVLGVLCVFFAHMAGRGVVAVRTGRGKLSRLYAWILRAVVCAAALIFRHPVDLVVMALWGLAAMAFAAGLWVASRPRKDEDLTSVIFPGGS